MKHEAEKNICTYARPGGGPPIVEMVQKEGTELKNQNVSIKALKLESAVKDLSNGAYMPPMRYLDGAFYTVSKNKDMVKLVLKDKKLVVDQPSLAKNVSFITGVAGNRLFFRQQVQGKTRTHGLEKDKDIGEIYANLGYLTPTTDKLVQHTRQPRFGQRAR